MAQDVNLGYTLKLQKGGIVKTLLEHSMRIRYTVTIQNKIPIDLHHLWELVHIC